MRRPVCVRQTPVLHLSLAEGRFQRRQNHGAFGWSRGPSVVQIRAVLLVDALVGRRETTLALAGLVMRYSSIGSWKNTSPLVRIASGQRLSTVHSKHYYPLQCTKLLSAQHFARLENFTHWARVIAGRQCRE